VDANRGWRAATIYDRERLPVGVDIPGPAIINEMSATTLVLPDQTARVDAHGNIIVEVGA
jgi:N-methylhydantoinase A